MTGTTPATRPPLFSRHARAAAALTLLTALCAAPAVAAPPETRERPAPAEQESPPALPGVQYLDVLQHYLTLIEHFARLAEDPAATGVAATLGAKDLFSGDAAKAIDFYTQILPEVKSEAVRRAVRVTLIDLYKRTGQRDKALEQIRILMTSAPADKRE